MPPQQAPPTFLTRVSRALSSPTVPPPPKPTNWIDSVHRPALIRIWDIVCDLAHKNPQRYGGNSIDLRLAATQHKILQKFPQLGAGAMPFTIDWMEYVLGTALRHPFCTAETMSRWEVLAAGSGPRGNWGPW